MFILPKMLTKLSWNVHALKMVSFQDVTKGLNGFQIKQVYLPD